MAVEPRCSPAEHERGRTFFVDDHDGDRGSLAVVVRHGASLVGGKVAGALHISRGMLEFRADPDSPYHDKTLHKDRPVILYCASAGRSALSGKTLKDLGYAEVYNLGAFKDWVENGGPIDHPIEPGM